MCEFVRPTYRNVSRSNLVCSCLSPSVCPISCTAIPNCEIVSINLCTLFKC